MADETGQQYGGGTEYLTIDEVATRYGVTPDTVRRWEDRNILPYRDSRFPSPRWSRAVLDTHDARAAKKKVVKRTGW